MGTKGETRNVWTVILLTLVTCGIYGIIWVYNTAKEINGYLGEEKINPVLALILCFVPFGILYVFYVYNDALKEMNAKAGLPQSDNFVLWIILYFVAGISMYIFEYQVQTELNQIWEQPNFVG